MSALSYIQLGKVFNDSDKLYVSQKKLSHSLSPEVVQERVSSGFAYSILNQAPGPSLEPLQIVYNPKEIISCRCCHTILHK